MQAPDIAAPSAEDIVLARRRLRDIVNWHEILDSSLLMATMDAPGSPRMRQMLSNVVGSINSVPIPRSHEDCDQGPRNIGWAARWSLCRWIWHLQN